MERRSPPESFRTPWVALVLRVPAELQDELGGCLGAGTLGVEVRAETQMAGILRIFLPGDADAAFSLDAARKTLRAFGLSPEDCALRVERVKDERWVERYHASLRPFPVGRRFVIAPGEAPESLLGRSVIYLPPGRAFGTGEHPTTQLSIEALEQLVEPGSLWGDIGTGSGILSVAALRCGARRAIACDIDPEAIEVAREVFERNELAKRADLLHGSADGIRDARLDGVVANIDLRYLVEHARDLASALRERGTLVATGFLAEDLAEARGALERAALRPTGEREREAWALITATRGER